MKPSPHCDIKVNNFVFDSADELGRKQMEFDAQYEMHVALTKTFWQRAYEIMEARRWNSTIFCEKTLLNEMTYSRVRNNPDTRPDLRTAMAICMGLDLDISLTIELLRLAGHTLTNALEHQIYSFLITGYRGRSVCERNMFLQSYGIKPLGSKQ